MTTPVAWGSVVTPHEPESDVRAPGDHPELDSQRAVAVVAIVVYHVYQFASADRLLSAGAPAIRVLNSLDAATSWLFVIAGFIVVEPVARAAIDNRAQPSARQFLFHRATQLLPVYVVAVVVVWLLRQRSLPGDWRDLIEHLTFTQVFDEKRIFFTIGPAWAVSVGVLTCLFLFGLSTALARICAHVTGRSKRIVLLCGAAGSLAVISIGWKAWSLAGADRATEGSYTTWFGPLANLDNFAVGMAVAVLVASTHAAPPRSYLGLMGLRMIAVTMLTIAVWVREPGTWTTVCFSTICSIGFGCLLAATVLGHPRGQRRTVSTRWRMLPWIGTISLSIYLWHEPLMLTLAPIGLVRQAPEAFVQDVVVVLMGAVLAGWFSYGAVERPISRLGRLAGKEPDGEPRRPSVL
jgi:peptidoglycan/LPS O-acetylase OafA/YrhL